MVEVIELRGLVLAASVGVLPEERSRRQPIEVDLDIEVDAAAGRTDDLADAVDYAAVCDAVESVVAGGHVQLLERLAALIGEAVLALDGRVVAAEVAVRKLRPPVPQTLRTAGVRTRCQR